MNAVISVYYPLLLTSSKSSCSNSSSTTWSACILDLDLFFKTFYTIEVLTSASQNSRLQLLSSSRHIDYGYHTKTIYYLNSMSIFSWSDYFFTYSQHLSTKKYHNFSPITEYSILGLYLNYTAFYLALE